MQPLIDTLVQFPILALLLVIGLGYLLGEINFFGFRFGIAGVLFAGLAIGALHPGIATPEMVPTLGLILFVYMIGIHSGPALAQAIRKRGYRDSLFAAGVLAFGASMTLGLAWFMNMSGPRAAGLFCGSVTNTPALAAARETVRDVAAKAGVSAVEAKKLADQPVVAYSIAYPMGVIGVLVCFQFLRKMWGVKPREGTRQAPITVGNFVVQNPAANGQTLAQFQEIYRARFVVSRIQKKGHTDVATGKTRLELGSIVAVVGDEEAQESARNIFGAPAPSRIEQDTSQFEYRRVYLSSEDVVGKTIAELDLNKIPATVSRIRRGDTDFVATPHTRLEYGDLLRVVSPREKRQEVSKFFGDSIRGAAEADFRSIGIGMVLGVLLGMIPFPMPGGTSLRLGYAGGPLIVALILGKLGSTGRISWVIPASANFTLRQIGLVLFLAGVGTRAGWDFAQTIQANGAPTMLAGAAVTFSITLATMIFGYKVLKMPFDFLIGVMSGIQTQPACLAFAANQAKNDEPNVGYAGVYPAATIAKIVLAQLLVTLPVAHAAEIPKAALWPKPLKPVATKLIRPGVNGVTSIPPAGGCLISEGLSREASATGAETSGLTGFYECSVTKRFALVTVPTHWISKDGRNGVGDTSVGGKFVLNTETRRVPLLAVGYMYKQPTASDKLGTGMHDHKLTFYGDKNFGSTRLTGNLVSKWEGHTGGTIHQYLPSVGVLRPIHGKLGMALQSYYSMSSVVNYGGAIAAATYHIAPSFSVHLGLEHGFGPRSPDLGVVFGCTYLYRGPNHR